MENWQKTYIEKNLPVLIEITKCSAGLKAGLKAKELLTNEEDERLTMLGRNEGAMSEAKMLYEFLKGRSRGYKGIIEVLRDTRQDGALQILQNGLQQSVLYEASDDSATYNQLMSMRVQLANCTKSFNEVFPRFTMDDARELLRNTDLKQDLKQLHLKKSVEIKLDGQLPVNSGLYIPRILSNRLMLDPRVFTLNSCEDVFVFTNISNIELAQLVKPHAVRSSTGQRSLVTGRHIYLDDEEDWDDMVAISESPIHLVSKEESGYILQRTTKVTDVLQNYASREGRSKEVFVTEDAFVVELLSNNDSNGALICDVAGMGKTWLMKNLAAKIRCKSENCFVFFVELSPFSKFLSRLDQPLADKPAIAIWLNYVCPSKLASHLLHKYAEQNGTKIAFVLDGYDEINKEEIDILKLNLLVLSKLENITMIISSRPSMRALLQKTFNLISYDILPFQTEEQVRCIVEQWAIACPQSDSESYKLKEFALQCIKSVKSIQKGEVHDFLGVPLKCRILASVNENQAQQLCKAKRRRPLQIVEAATIKSVFDLYTMYVDCLVDKVAETVPQDARNDFVNGVFVFYTNLALELLFPDLSNVYISNSRTESSMDELFSRVGVACFNHDKQRLQFIHRSFAEYFVGRFFACFWNDIEKYSPSFAQVVGSYFLKKVLVAADGDEKIYLDPSDRWYWENIKYVPGNMNSIYLLRSVKMFEIKYPVILLFMNLNGKKLQFGRSTDGFRNMFPSIETETTASNLHNNMQHVGINSKYNELCVLKRWLAESSFVTMMACIEERLTNIFSLYVNILTSFFDLEHRVVLFVPPNAEIQNIGCTECAAWLLCKAAMSKSPENAVELFNMFGDSEENFLSVLCQRYPLEYMSPLEVGVMTEDLDMILYFVDKVSLPFYRLFFMCVAVHEELAEPDVDAKLKIMKMVLGSSDRVLNILGMDSFCSYGKHAKILTKYSFQLLLKFIEDSKFSISSIKSENKRFLLEKCLKDCNDEELVNILLSLYGKSDDKKLSSVNLATGRTLTAQVVLDALELVELRNAISNGLLSVFDFSKCMKLETLKVLTTIQPDFSCCNKEKWNYLHLAAFKLRIDWLKHLIDSGYEVNQLDKFRYTPLLCAAYYGTDNPKLLLAVTRLLVENGANVYAKDFRGRNLAHCVFNNCLNADSKDLCEWVSYMLEKGYYQLWEMRDRHGDTPQELLQERYKLQQMIQAGKTSPMTTDVLRLLERYSVAITYSNSMSMEENA